MTTERQPGDGRSADRAADSPEDRSADRSADRTADRPPGPSASDSLPLDRLGRPIRDLRISVTDRCNFRCRYCMPEEIFGPDFPFMPEREAMSFAEIERFVRLFVRLGTQKIRITGGEPLLRQNVAELVRRIRQVDGVRDIALTTNGVLLKAQARALKEAGLDRVNVSLDSLDDERFGRLNGRGYPVRPILDGIAEAAREGLEIKVNMVVQRGVNDEDIVPVARYFREAGHIVRFIEFMDVGNSNGWELTRVVPSREVVARIHESMPLEPAEPNYFGEVASRWRYVEGGGEIGVISSVTQAFCSSCTRARLTAAGHLYTCLFASSGTDLLTPMRREETDEQMLARIGDVWRRRDDRYSEIRLAHTKPFHKVEMSQIGG